MPMRERGKGVKKTVALPPVSGNIKNAKSLPQSHTPNERGRENLSIPRSPFNRTIRLSSFNLSRQNVRCLCRRRPRLGKSAAHFSFSPHHPFSSSLFRRQKRRNFLSLSRYFYFESDKLPSVIYIYRDYAI